VPELLCVSKPIWSDATNVCEMMIERRLAMQASDRDRDMPRHGNVVVPAAVVDEPLIAMSTVNASVVGAAR